MCLSTVRGAEGADLLFPLVLLVDLPLGDVPGHLVPLKQLLQGVRRQVELQAVLGVLLQAQHVGLQVLAVRHYG